MDEINDKYYKGYEGESEVQFIKTKNDGNRAILSIWDGYFDDIVEQIEPTESGWVGLAYHFHMYTGWYNESPWMIPNPLETLEQLTSLNISKCRLEKSKEVLKKICRFMTDALEQSESVWISEG